MAYDGNQCKWSYLSTNLVGSLLLHIREEGYDPQPRGAESLLRSRDIRKLGWRVGEGWRKAVVIVQCRGVLSEPGKTRGGSRAGKEIQPGHVLTIVSLTGLLDICLAVLTSGQESPPRVNVPPEQVNPGTIFHLASRA